MKTEDTLIIDSHTLDTYFLFYKTLHPRAKKMPIQKPFHPSINSWMIKGRMAMNNIKQTWKKFMIWLVRNNGKVPSPPIKSCDLTITIYFHDKRRRDCDNYVPKFMLDGLVDANYLVDDSSSVVKSLTIKCGYDKAHPRTELHFRNIVRG